MIDEKSELKMRADTKKVLDMLTMAFAERDIRVEFKDKWGAGKSWTCRIVGVDDMFVRHYLSIDVEPRCVSLWGTYQGRVDIHLRSVINGKTKTVKFPPCKDGTYNIDGLIKAIERETKNVWQAEHADDIKKQNEIENVKVLRQEIYALDSIGDLAQIWRDSSTGRYEMEICATLTADQVNRINEILLRGYRDAQS